MRLYSVPSVKGPRFGVVAGRRAWPRAVDRNRFRRLARESFRLMQHSLQQRDFVLRARSAQRGGPSAIEMNKLLEVWCKNKKETQV